MVREYILILFSLFAAFFIVFTGTLLMAWEIVKIFFKKKK